MEVDGGNEKKLAVLVYELLGTMLLTYAILVGQLANVNAHVYMYFLCLTICWKVSGGHFNPMLTVSVFIASKNFAGNAVLMGMMIGG